MNTTTRLLTLGTGLALGIGILTAAASAEDALTEPTDTTTSSWEVDTATDMPTADLPTYDFPAELDKEPASDTACADPALDAPDGSGCLPQEPTYTDPETGDTWTEPELDQSAPTEQDPITEADRATPGGGGYFGDGEVIYEDDPRWDCTTMGNRQCGFEVQGTWYVANFDTMTFSKR